MALLTCPECGHKVSDKADACPGCGIKTSEILRIMATVSPTPQAEPTAPQAAPERKPAEGGRKKSHTLLIVSFVMALAICGTVYYFYNNAQSQKEQEDYELAMSSEDVEVMNMYLARYKEAPQEHREAVRNKLDGLLQLDTDWTNAVVSGSKTELEKYINEHPGSSHKVEALNMIDSIDFAIADRSKSVESYRLYLKQHPDGKYASKAQDFIDDKMQTEVQPEEMTAARNTCRKFFQAINSKNADRLVENVEDVMDSFLNKPNATAADVVSFMNRLYKDDIVNMNWHILDDFTAEKIVAAEGYNIQVKFGAEQIIERTDATKEKYAKYAVTAEINPSGKIVRFNLKKQTVNN